MKKRYTFIVIALVIGVISGCMSVTPEKKPVVPVPLVGCNCGGGVLAPNSLSEAIEFAPVEPLTFLLDDVHFKSGSWHLLPKAESELQGIASTLRQHAPRSILIEGHTDSMGKKTYNQRLSEQRANSVKHFLITEGVESNRITTIGYGELHPIASNETKEGRQENRRVKITLE